MERHDDIPRLVGDIYEAALEPARWTETLGSIVDFVQGHAGGLVSRDERSKSADVRYSVGVAPDLVEAYRDYSKFDPIAGISLAEVDAIVSTLDVVPREEVRASRFYREWAQPHGIVDAANALLEKSPTSSAYLSVIRNERQGVVDAEMRRRMSLIVPHVRRALLIGKVIDVKRTESRAFAGVLDGLTAGMFLVAADGRIVHANVAGYVMLARAAPLRILNGRLAAADAHADRSLRDVFAAAGEGGIALGSKGIVMPLSVDGGERYVAHVLPLTEGERCCTGRLYAAVAAVFVRKAAMEKPASPAVIGEAYKLTPTELRVLLAIVDVGGVPEVAQSLGIAETTVKTHLGRLFSKTGVRRQADLVKLVAGFVSMLAG